VEAADVCAGLGAANGGVRDRRQTGNECTWGMHEVYSFPVCLRSRSPAGGRAPNPERGVLFSMTRVN